jgi:hypothetical protein
VIEDLDGFTEVSPLRIARPRVSSEPIPWAFLSAVGAGFITNNIAQIALAVLSPTLPYPEWLNPFVLPRATQLVATGAVALRAGGIGALVLCVGYEVALVLTQVPNPIALCEGAPQPDPSLPCGFAAIATSTWPTWAALATGALGSRRLLPAPTPGTNTLLRAAGVFTFALAIVGIAWQLGQGALFDGLAAVGWLGPERPRGLSFQVAISTVFLIVQLAAGLAAGSLLRRAPSAAVLLLALVVGYGAGLGVAQIRNNVDTGVPHFPLELAYLQSMNALTPAAGILGIALGRLLATRNRVLPQP